ncbi:alpha/beta fold hydrolase [Streptomyces sp. WMMC500]|uniref:alpha/beta fold hydrolase n=1 Tax=Streptomyces sp. WMMC500 TaxID=3015154 RepID=UPI00248A90F4|nr:alpha/beta hydrolase [Streptomyces sp. WMMC500]WBB62875.1 alpha/beta fold hydrolase [Streptomyces sp. WMMC500]
MTQHTATSADGTPVAYETLGEGPPVVLVQGALCARAVDAPLAELLAGRATAVLYDRRGRGGSGDATAGVIPPTGVAERELEDLAAVIGAVGGSAAVYGMSSGAALALRAAAAGLPITRLAVYEPPFRPDDSDDAEHSAGVARLHELLAAGDRDGAVAHFVGGVGAPPETLREMRAMPMWADFTALAPTLAYDYDVLGDGRVPTGRLAGVAVPVLALAGGASWEWIQDAARRVADTVRDGRFSLLEGQTHEVAPEAVAPALREFFAA